MSSGMRWICFVAHPLLYKLWWILFDENHRFWGFTISGCLNWMNLFVVQRSIDSFCLCGAEFDVKSLLLVEGETLDLQLFLVPIKNKGKMHLGFSLKPNVCVSTTN